MTHDDAEDAESMAASLAAQLGWHFELFGGRHCYVHREGPTLHITVYAGADETEYSATVAVEVRTSADEF